MSAGDGIEQLTRCGEKMVFVLGDPAYYARCGFDVAASQAFTSAYGGPYFQARRLAADAPSAGVIRYPTAFDAFT